jgi:hypothetical protein
MTRGCGSSGTELRSAQAREISGRGTNFNITSFLDAKAGSNRTWWEDNITLDGMNININGIPAPEPFSYQFGGLTHILHQLQE